MKVGCGLTPLEKRCVPYGVGLISGFYIGPSPAFLLALLFGLVVSTAVYIIDHFWGSQMTVGWGLIFFAIASWCAVLAPLALICHFIWGWP